MFIQALRGLFVIGFYSMAFYFIFDFIRSEIRKYKMDKKREMENMF